MPKLARIAGIALASIACIAVACGRQSPPPAAGSPVDPAGAPAPSPAAPTPAPGNAAPGTGSSDAPPGAPGAPAPPDEQCDVTECGPAMRMPNRRCPDGSTGGPTGRCLRKPDGKCAWEVRPCPPR